MITYRDDKQVNVAQLALLRQDAGFDALSAESLQQHIDGAYWVLSAWEGDRLVGFVRAISDGIEHAYVASMMVHSSYRRKGIGRELMRRLTANRDTVRFTLHSRDMALPFYRAIGFSDLTQMMRLERKRRAL